jgi:hypothetical protein
VQRLQLTQIDNKHPVLPFFFSPGIRAGLAHVLIRERAEASMTRMRVGGGCPRCLYVLGHIKRENAFHVHKTVASARCRIYHIPRVHNTAGKSVLRHIKLFRDRVKLCRCFHAAEALLYSSVCSSSTIQRLQDFRDFTWSMIIQVD